MAVSSGGWGRAHGGPFRKEGLQLGAVGPQGGLDPVLHRLGALLSAQDHVLVGGDCRLVFEKGRRRRRVRGRHERPERAELLQCGVARLSIA